MKTAKKRTDRENVTAPVNGEANNQAQETVLSVVKDNEQHEGEQREAERAEQPQEQQPDQPQAVVKTLTVAEKLAALKDLNKIDEQRSKVITMRDQLDRFVIQQNENAELDEGNTFKTCELTIKDDNGNVFSTKNTVLIAATVANLLEKSEIKLAELEAQLVFPAA